MIELVAAGGATARLALGDGGPLLPRLPAHLVKARWLYGRNGFPGRIRPEEVVLQTYSVPLADFDREEWPFETTRLTSIRFAFDGAEPGGIFLDTIALARQK